MTIKKFRSEQIEQIDHNELLNIGTNSHAQLDMHLAAAAPHSGHSLVGHTHTGVYVPLNTMTAFAASAWGPAPNDATFQRIMANYLDLGNAYFYTVYFKCTAQGSLAGQVMYINLPFTAPSAQIMYGRETLINGSSVLGTIDVGTGYMVVSYYNNAGVIATNAGWMISGLLFK